MTIEEAKAVRDAIKRIGMCKCNTNEIEAVSQCLIAFNALPFVPPEEKVERRIDCSDADAYYLAIKAL